MLAPIVEQSPAKINLILHITGKRGDGYHLLESLVAFATFGDTLELYPDDVISLDIEGELAAALQPDANNSILRAARLFFMETNGRQGARIRLHKRIPVSAGLGGGSGNAAATLRGLGRLWSVALPPNMRDKLAGMLGSDVPVCMGSTPAVMRGVGEQVTPVRLPPAALVLANPRIPLPTRDVFHAYNGGFTSPQAWQAPSDYAALVDVLGAGHNALEPAALRLCPVIEEGLAALRRAPGCDLGRMSGSGATCFGLFRDVASAEAAVFPLRDALPGWWLQATSLI